MTTATSASNSSFVYGLTGSASTASRICSYARWTSCSSQPASVADSTASTRKPA